MGYFIDVSLALPIGILYNVFILKISEILTSEFKYEEKIQKGLIISFVAGIFGCVMAMTMFNKNSVLENRAVKYGVIVGSTLLIINAVLFNWNVLDNDTKLFIMGFILLSIVTVSYKFKKLSY